MHIGAQQTEEDEERGKGGVVIQPLEIFLKSAHFWLGPGDKLRPSITSTSIGSFFA